ncbi:serine O-acetyltransferase [Fictibacillus enclensis]|uniref:Serine acetyltransferase n=1 Tax=Fictibacillus enclensis TaxID=1017270 RepID=A0A0V8J519_9BACL|nr:serine O-acetyltransferase EpsC [Fictibacillus enclensis]KSU82073.1 hypothetical protein AS030_17535 [Fictibacillus enclensis]SCC29934.1 serine O-acetyltransferase [Fictibacillus enclensis]
MLYYDLERFLGYRPGFLIFLKLLLTNPNILCIAMVRWQNYLYHNNVPMIPTLLKALNIWLNGADIGIGANIGKGLIIRHCNGIVIGNGAVLGQNCTILHQVTLGERYGDGSDQSLQKYPIIGNNVTISAGAKVIGGITIGDNVVIGANAVVISDVPRDCIAVGIPALIRKKSSSA